MNEFIEQFLIECRELVQQATDDLLTLEGRPDDKERLDGAFRAFHTLKGAAGIVDFDAMGRALHAAEDVLAEVRSGGEVVTAELIGDCLTCLDQVLQWLDAMEVDGELPAGADAAAETVVRRFTRAAEASVRPAADTSWIASLQQRHPASGATLALRYAPDAEAFFRGEDPLALLAQVPGLIAIDVLRGIPSSLEALDPFASSLVFGALAGCTAAQAADALAGVIGQVEIAPLADGPTDQTLSPAAIALLEAQQRLLAEAGTEGLSGRLGSAGRLVANVLQSLGRTADAQLLQRLTAESVAAHDPAVLALAIQDVLSGEFETADADAGAPAPIPDGGPTEAAARTLRVDVERIDALVSLTGELLVAKNALGHAATLAQGGAEPAEIAALLKGQHAVMARLVDQLQRSVLNIRVLPIRYVFQRFPRLVREMVVSLGKPAHLITEGDDTEADKAIVESLFEPLLHVLRNALDHGVEPTAVRTAAGKPASATVRLSAAREGDHVVVEVSDDGAGVDVARVRAVAEHRGVASAEALAEMNDEAVIDLVFAPGFSTAAQVTALSGRGVGMDAVRSSVERLGGKVTLMSRLGEGSTVRFTLPFAVMMTRVLTVEAGGQMFGIPLDAVLETVRIDRANITPIGAARAFVLRNRTVPLIDLAQALGEREQLQTGEANVVVASAGGQLGGLEVDRLGERLDVMLKPMAGLLAGMPGIAGTTLLGDGRVLIVLDLQALLA